MSVIATDGFSRTDRARRVLLALLVCCAVALALSGCAGTGDSVESGANDAASEEAGTSSESTATAADQIETRAIPDGAVEYGGHYYLVSKTPLTWMDARDACAVQGGYLAIIDSQEEQDFVYDLIRNPDQDFYWIGLYTRETDGGKDRRFTWVDGTTPTYTHWRDGDPNGNVYQGKVEQYVGIWVVDSRWNDFPEDGNDPDRPHGYICEWTPYVSVSD